MSTDVKEEVTPWVCKQLRDEKGERIVGKYKLYTRPAQKDVEPTELFPGFELEEFNSPLTANRYISNVLKAIDEKAAVKASELSTKAPQTATVATGEATATKDASGASTTQILPSGVALIGEMSESTDPDVRQIGACQYFEITVQEQADDVKRQDILATDGQSREFIISYGKKVIVPKGVINVLKESIYTFLKSHYDQSKGEAWTEPYDVSRFTIQIHREVAQQEAEAWLREQKKRYHAAAR